MYGTDRSSIRFVLVTLAVLWTVAVICAIFALGPIPLVVTVVGLYIAFVVYGFREKRPVVWLWLAIGLVAGIVEVWSNCDDYLVVVEQVLVYPDTFPKIGVSPAYLPVAWGLVFTQLGLIGDWFRRNNTLLRAMILTALTGGALIMIFENLAHPAQWWYYQNTPMLFYAPLFVNLFEFLSTAVLVLIGWSIARGAKDPDNPTKPAVTGWAIFGGFVLGIWMCVAMRFGYWMLGPCEGAVIQFACSP